MTIHRHTIIDAAQDLGLDQFELTSREVSGKSAPWRISGRRLRGGRREGVELIEIDNGLLKVAVIPTRGMGIWRAWMEGRTLGWNSPTRGPVHPSFVPLGEPSGLGWLDGFDELLCRCGLASNGAPEFDSQGRLKYSVHGRVANCPAHRVDVLVDESTGTISLQGVVDDARFHFHKLRLTSTVSLQLGEPTITWHDVVENFGGTPTGMQMLYHTNVGHGLTGKGAKFTAPVASVAPRDETAAQHGTRHWGTDPGPTPGSAEQVYYFDLLVDQNDETEVLLTSPDGTEGLGLRYRKEPLPCFALWRNTAAEADGYVTGLEPATNFPNVRSFEERQGRVVNLGPGKRWEASVAARWYTKPSDLLAAESRIQDLQGATEPIVHSEPLGAWSPAS